jgi:hypothetical protein
MGATLAQAQLAMHFIANNEASKTHPARMDVLPPSQKGGIRPMPKVVELAIMLSQVSLCRISYTSHQVSTV